MIPLRGAVLYSSARHARLGAALAPPAYSAPELLRTSSRGCWCLHASANAQASIQDNAIGSDGDRPSSHNAASSSSSSPAGAGLEAPAVVSIRTGKVVVMYVQLHSS